MSKRTALVLGSYLTVYFVWGGTYFFIRQSVATIPPFYVIGVRWTVGGLLLGLAALATGRLRRPPSVRQVLASMLSGTLLLLGGNGLITIAEIRIDSYIAALLASSTPIIVAVFDRFMIGKRLTWARALAIAVGFGGVALLLYNGRSIATSVTVWVFIALVGVVFWSLATSLGHRILGEIDSLVSSTVQMLTVGILCTAGSLLFSERPAEIVHHVSAASIAGIVYLIVAGSIAFVAYTYLVTHEPAERVVSYALVNPLIAVVLGLAFGGEAATPYLSFGMPLILAGLAIMFYGERISFLRRKEPAGRG
jgi:drug/metabolite transporter (DMT)-like permease